MKIWTVGCLLMVSGSLRAEIPTLVTLVDFPQSVAQPYAALVQGPDGSFYGTTLAGGAPGLGSVYCMTPTGVTTSLVEFTGIDGLNHGSSPYAGLTLGGDGNFYGTTFSGGASDVGTVFRMTPAGALTTLVEFTNAAGANIGAYPYAALIRGSDGNFYGTTKGGGSLGLGTIFRLSPAGALTTLVEFTGNGASNRGRNSFAALVEGSDGSFYGTTASGGTSNRGTVFRMTPDGVLTTLADFTSDGASNRGAFPFAELAKGRDGNFYGTTLGGGASDLGTIFRITPAGALTTLFEFSSSFPGGNSPYAALMLGTDGNFYGTTAAGGGYDYGTVFRITPAGVLTTLVNFTDLNLAYHGVSSRGSDPRSALTRGGDGSLYGTTAFGGRSNYGTLFRLRFQPDGSPTQLMNISVEPGIGTRIQWQGSAGQISRVESSEDLSGPWQSFPGTVAADGNGRIEFQDATQPMPAHRFYRLVTPL